MHRFEWAGEVGVEFHLPHGEWIELLRANGLEVERLIEVQAPADAETHEFYAYVTAEWARQWPPRTSGSPARSRERATCTAARPRVDVAAAARDPDAAGGAVRGGRAGLRRGAGHEPARARGRQGALGAGGDRPVLGVDTEVLLDGELLGKPADATEAEAMLESLAGRTHEVVSGLCLRTPAWEELHTETTLVTFRDADAARPRALRRERRVGGARRRVCDPGRRREPRHAHRGRLPERRRPAGRIARAVCSRRASRGVYGFG